jgi:hypothetical protein
MLRFVEFVVRARRLAIHGPTRASRDVSSARRQVTGEVAQFSFRLAFMIDLAYVGLGALGGAAVNRATRPAAPVIDRRIEESHSGTSAARLCQADPARQAVPSAAAETSSTREPGKSP